MALPKQVQAQLDEVEALEKSMEARREPAKDTKAADKEQPKKSDVGSAEETTKHAEPAEAPKVPAQADAKPADTPPTDVEETFEHKYRTLQGKYDAEVPRLHEQNRVLLNENRDLTGRMTELQEQVKKLSQPEEPTKAKEKVSYVTDADREEFGEELIDVQRRVAREVADEFQEKLESQSKIIEELQTRLGETDGRLGHMTFSQKLAHLVPDFEQVDNDPRWVKWLGEYDPMLRGPRRDQAQAAFNAGDAEAVADYVKLFKASIADTPEQKPDARQKELEKQVAPSGTTGSSRPQGSKEGRIWRSSEVDAAWAKVRTLNARGDVEGANKLEADLTAAYLEGRVRA